MLETALEGLNAFDAAILAHQQRARGVEVPQCKWGGSTHPPKETEIQVLFTSDRGACSNTACPLSLQALPKEVQTYSNQPMVFRPSLSLQLQYGILNRAGNC